MAVSDGSDHAYEATEWAAAQLLVLGVDLTTLTVESATVATVAERSPCPIAVVRGHGPDLCPPLHGPVLIGSDAHARPLANSATALQVDSLAGVGLEPAAPR